MATLKLKKKSPDAAPAPRPDRPPVRGAGSVKARRPTLAEAQALRAEREARYQEQLRQRFGDSPPPAFQRHGEGGAPAPQTPSQSRRRDPHRDVRSDEQLWTRATGRAVPDPRGRLVPLEDAQPRRAPLHPSRKDDRRPALRPGATREEAAAAARQARAAPPPARGNTAFDRPAGRGMPPGANVPPPQPPKRRPRADEDDERLPPPDAAGSLRLSKRMSELGIASRREADEWIPKGWVRVDGRVVSELGSRVLPGQHITVDAKARHQQAQRVTVLIHKPVGYVSGQAEDGYEPAVVLVTPENQWRDDRSGIRFLPQHLRSLAPAGRLDIDSVGLLVLTQDGRVAKQLIGEDSEIDKEYLVRVETVDGGPVAHDALPLLNHGLELDGEPLLPAQVSWINDDQLRFVLREGKKRQIRRMCEAVGLKVTGLKRVRIGQVMLGDLPPGKWRYLRVDERFG